MWNHNLTLLTGLAKVLIVIAGVRAMHEQNQTQGTQSAELLLRSEPSVRQKPPLFNPQDYHRWSEKAVANYALAQEKKWRNWAKSMSK